MQAFPRRTSRAAPRPLPVPHVPADPYLNLFSMDSSWTRDTGIHSLATTWATSDLFISFHPARAGPDAPHQPSLASPLAPSNGRDRIPASTYAPLTATVRANSPRWQASAATHGRDGDGEGIAPVEWDGA